MQSRLIGHGIVVTGMIVLVGVAGDAGEKRRQPPSDPRHKLILPRAQRDLVLAEMRQMLGSVSEILHGVVGTDMAALERAARVSGMERAADPQLKKRLPEAFLQLGMQTHKSFDQVADQARAGGTRDDVLKRLAVLSDNCVGCHAAYRLDQAR